MDDQNPPPRLFQIPEEILMDEVLPRLPVKSLSRFKYVSKSWQSLIESDRFIEIHYRHSTKNPRRIFHVKDTYEIEEYSLQLLYSKEEIDPTKNKERVGTLVGCCNGVLCCYDYGDERFSLWNPAIRVCIELPDSKGCHLRKCGFGLDGSSGAYKVFAVLYDRKSNETIGRVYSSNTNSWRTIPCGSLSRFSESGLFLRGNLHWVDWPHPQIECFDLEREEFGKIELLLENATKVTSCHFPLLGEISGSLSILFYLPESLEVWVMKEYGVKDSLFKLLTIPTRLHISSVMCNLITPLFGEVLNGEIFVIYGETLSLYYPKDDAFSVARNYDHFFRAYLYVESLVSPKRILDATNTS